MGHLKICGGKFKTPQNKLKHPLPASLRIQQELLASSVLHGKFGGLNSWPCAQVKSSIHRKKFYFYLHVCVGVQIPNETRKGWSPRNGIPGSCEILDFGAGNKIWVPLEEQQVLFIIETSFQLQKKNFWNESCSYEWLYFKKSINISISVSQG